MAVNAIKIKSIINTLKRIDLKCLSNWMQTASVVKTKPAPNNANKIEEETDDTEATIQPLPPSAFRYPMQHDKFINYMNFRQLQPAFQPEFKQSCMSEAISNAEDYAIKPKRMDSMSVSVKNYGTAVPFKSFRLNENDILKRSDRIYKEKIDQFEGTTLPEVMKMTTRHYSSKTVKPDPEKCKKTKRVQCDKIAMDCEPAKSIRCDIKKRVKPCTRQEAPYPSYSEACFEEWEEKPSECKQCPWKRKPIVYTSKKKYHTIANEFWSKRGECPPPPKPKEPCGWVKEEAEKSKADRKDGGKKKSMSLSLIDDKNLTLLKKPQMAIPLSTIPKERPLAMSLFRTAINTSKLSDTLKNLTLPITPKPHLQIVEKELKTIFVRSTQQNNELWFEKKPPCKKPPPKCPENKKKPEKPKEKKCSRKKISYKMTKTDGSEETPCKKFPFPTPPKVQQKDDGRRKCKEKKKRRIKDCPPEKTDECERTAPIINKTYNLSSDKEDDREKKCPKFDKGKCEQEADIDDPCGLRKKGETRECPADLTKKRRKYTPRKKKDASNRFPLIHNETNIKPDKSGPFV